MPVGESAKPNLLDRLRARFPWFDHIMRAYYRFDERNGGFFAAGLTYYTTFALFPMLMVGFAAAGILLTRQPRLRDMLDERILASVSHDLGEQLVQLINRAIESRGSVGVIGLATAAWAGLNWMSNLRAALTQMWWDERIMPQGFVRTKISDLFAMISTFVVIVLTLVLSALGKAAPMTALLRWLHVPDFSHVDLILRPVSTVMSILISWLLFTLVIARLPRESVSLRDSARAGVMAAIGFEMFKQGGSIYLHKVLASPAGVTFGPVLGLMMFSYVTSYLVLFAAAWAATAKNDRAAVELETRPASVSADTLGESTPAKTSRPVATAVLLAAIGALTVSRFLRR